MMGTGLISCISDFNIMGRRLVISQGVLEEVSGLTAPLTFPSIIVRPVRLGSSLHSAGADCDSDRETGRTALAD